MKIRLLYFGLGFLLTYFMALIAMRDTNREFEKMAAQRDSIAEVHTRAMAEWARVQQVMRESVTKATAAHAKGDENAAFEAGMAFGLWLNEFKEKGLE